MNEKEAKLLAKTFKPLDRLYSIANNLDEYCLDENFVIFKAVRKTERCKKKLLKDLDKMQKIVDKLLGTE